MVSVPYRVAQRAASRWVEDANGCFVSTYSVASHGYAQIGWQSAEEGRGVTVAHRAAWVAARGDIPAGMTIDHLCKNRRCVRVSHLRLLTNLENARRTSGRDWPLGVCINGHGNEHWYTRPSGKGLCRQCAKLWRARYQEKRKRAA